MQTFTIWVFVDIFISHQRRRSTRVITNIKRSRATTRSSQWLREKFLITHHELLINNLSVAQIRPDTDRWSVPRQEGGLCDDHLWEHGLSLRVRGAGSGGKPVTHLMTPPVDTFLTIHPMSRLKCNNKNTVFNKRWNKISRFVLHPSCSDSNHIFL